MCSESATKDKKNSFSIRIKGFILNLIKYL